MTRARRVGANAYEFVDCVEVIEDTGSEQTSRCLIDGWRGRPDKWMEHRRMAIRQATGALSAYPSAYTQPDEGENDAP